MCRPNGLLFHQKSSDMGPTLVIKILRGGPHFTNFAKKIVKSAVFEAENPLEMGLDLQKFENTVYSAVFLSEKNP